MPIFRYGKKGGVMAIFLLVLAVIPILLAIIYVPQMADQVPTKVNAAGEVLRWGSRYEMLVAPALCFLLSVGRSAKRAIRCDSPSSSTGPSTSTARCSKEGGPLAQQKHPPSLEAQKVRPGLRSRTRARSSP